MLDEFKKALAKSLVDNTLDTCSRWAEHRIHTPNPYPGILSFDKFPWQPEILNARDPMVIVRKAAQMGFSVAGMIKSLYMVDQEKEDVLYVLPTAGLASDFAKARLDQMVSLSPDLQHMWKESNVGLKTSHDHSHIFIRGSVAESGLVSVPVGTAIVDEFDRCNPKAMSLVLERLSAHERKHFFGLSTPTLPNYGIDKEYQSGTQEHFMFKCIHCGKHIELVWETCMEIIGESAIDPRCHESYLKCSECGGKLPHETKTSDTKKGIKGWLADGVWEPTAIAHGHRSFHLPQMYGPAITPGELVIAYFKGQADDAALVEFTNQKLGEPYLLEGARLTDLIIDQCKGDHRRSDLDARPTGSGRNIYMGVDIGTFLDIVIAEYIYDEEPGFEPHINSIAKILWEGRLSGNDFPILDRLMAEWQVMYACLDFQPETINAKAFARRFHGFASVAQYRQGTTGHEIKEVFDENDTSILTIDRTTFLDMALGRFHKKRVIVPVDLSGEFRTHTQNLVRTYVLDQYGRPKAEYVPLGADHLGHAFALCEAAHLQGYSKATGRVMQPGESIHNF